MSTEIMPNNFGKQVASALKQRSLLCTSFFYVLEGFHSPCEFTDLHKGIYNCECRLLSPLSFQYGGQHVKSAFGERSRCNLAEFQFIKVVKNFDHLLFLMLIHCEKISIWKLPRIVSNGLINFSCLHTIQFCHISINKHRLIA